MEIDLIKLIKLDLNINEYLTLFKIDKNTQGINFPFTSTVQHIQSLKNKGFIDVDANQQIRFTQQGKDVINPKIVVDFDELFELYPSKTPNGRILRAKNKEISGRMTKEYKSLKDKYLLRVRDEEMHKKILEATKVMIAEKQKTGSINFLQQLEVYINGNVWERYMDEDGNSTKDIMQLGSNTNFERI